MGFSMMPRRSLFGALAGAVAVMFGGGKMASGAFETKTRYDELLRRSRLENPGIDIIDTRLPYKTIGDQLKEMEAEIADLKAKLAAATAEESIDVYAQVHVESQSPRYFKKKVFRLPLSASPVTRWNHSTVDVYSEQSWGPKELGIPESIFPPNVPCYRVSIFADRQDIARSEIEILIEAGFEELNPNQTLSWGVNS